METRVRAHVVVFEFKSLTQQFPCCCLSQSLLPRKASLFTFKEGLCVVRWGVNSMLLPLFYWNLLNQMLTTTLNQMLTTTRKHLHNNSWINLQPSKWLNDDLIECINGPGPSHGAKPRVTVGGKTQCMCTQRHWVARDNVQMMRYSGFGVFPFVFFF